jgi:hypothetical protein
MTVLTRCPSAASFPIYFVYSLLTETWAHTVVRPSVIEKGSETRLKNKLREGNRARSSYRTHNRRLAGHIFGFFSSLLSGTRGERPRRLDCP